MNLGEVVKLARSTADSTKLNQSMPYLGLENVKAHGDILAVSTLGLSGVKGVVAQYGPSHVLYGKLRPYLNKVVAPDHEGTCSTEFLPLLPSSKVDRRFLLHWLRSPAVLEQASRLVAGANLPRLSPLTLLSFEFPCISLPEQSRIAEILDRADALKRKRQQALQLVDDFLRATFFDMFGDPILNNKLWATAPLGSITQIRRGASPRPIDQYLGGTVPWVKIGDGTKAGAEFAISKTAEYVTEEGAQRSVRLKPGSIIFANCGVSLGFARVLAIEGCIHDGWLSIEEYEDHFDPIFLIYLLNATTKFFRASAPEGTQPNLNTGIMKAHLVPMPPKDCQLHFRNIVESTTLVSQKQCTAEVDTFRLIAAITDFLLPGAESK